MLPMYNARKDGTANNAEQPFAFGKYSDNLLASKSLELVNDAANSNQVGKIWQSSTPTSVAIEHFSSGQSLVQNVADQSLVVVSPKKRKSATSELLAWHKEVTEGSNSLLTIRSLSNQLYHMLFNVPLPLLSFNCYLQRKDQIFISVCCSGSARIETETFRYGNVSRGQGN